MTTYPNDLQNGDLGDPVWVNALKNAFLNHKGRHARDGADPLTDYALRRQILASYTVNKVGSDFKAEANVPGLSDYIDEDPDIVIGAAANALPPRGGKILLKGEKFVFANPVSINRNAIHISGESLGGDIFYTNDADYHGQSNKQATLIVADGFDAFQIGMTTFVQGISIDDLFISGKDIDEPLADGIYGLGAGINVSRADTLQFNNIQVQRKEYGLKLDSPEAYAKDNVIDAVRLHNILLCFNVYGIWQDHWVANLFARNILGYINQKGLIHAKPQYEWLIDGVWSNADSWNSGAGSDDAPIYINTKRDVTLRHIIVAGAKGATLCPTTLMRIILQKAAEPEWCRGHVKLDDLTLFETDLEAIKVDGYGQLDVGEIHAGSTGSQSFYGGPGTITKHIVRNDGPEVDVRVDQGFVKSAESNKFLNWFKDVFKIANLKNFNPLGVITTPFHNTNNTVGLNGGANVEASKDYTVKSVDIIVSSAGGSGVSIAIKDPAGNTIASGLATLSPTYLPVGYKINFGAFTEAPTVVVSGN
jgi:hypothetical protein